MHLQQTLLSGLLATVAAGARSLNFDFPYDAVDPVPFTISVDEAFIEETRLRAGRYRPTPDLKDADQSNIEWIEGPPHDNMVKLANDWADNYDWSQVEAQINSNFSHFAVTIQGPAPQHDHPVPLHFVHERSEDTDAIPLIFLHGWPSTHLEYAKVVNPLSGPDGSVSFHVVVPDLPGSGFSPGPEYSGLGPREMGAVFDSLMKKLGYEKYGVVSTDLGWLVGSWMAVDFPDSLIGHFTDFFLVQPTEEDMERYSNNETTKEESDFIEATNAWYSTRGAYGTLHSQNPLVIAQAMADTPVGFAGWIWHLANAGSGEYPYTNEEIITQTLGLYIQGTLGGIRLYKYAFSEEIMAFPMSDVPTAVTQWGGVGSIASIAAFNFAPPHWLERRVNLVYHSRYEQGGHFPAEHVPEPWMEEVRQFFGGLIEDTL